MRDFFVCKNDKETPPLLKDWGPKVYFCVALRCVALRLRLRCVALRCVALRYVKLKVDVTLTLRIKKRSSPSLELLVEGLAPGNLR